MHMQGIHSSRSIGPAMSAAPDSVGEGAGDFPGHGGSADAGGAGGISSLGGASDIGGVGVTSGAGEADSGAGGAVSRPAQLRVDAQRNLAHVLRAAREVFGELGYGAPMEDVARRARVGVGTVYRRFPSKDVLVQRIAAEETARLTEQARAALGQEDKPWSALSRFLRTSVASGAGRLLPPGILRADGWGTTDPDLSDAAALVPQQRHAEYGNEGRSGLRLVGEGTPAVSARAWTEARDDRPGDHELGGHAGDPGSAELLSVVGRLVQRARDAGELRTDVTVGDVLLVIAAPAPSLPDAAQQAAASKRLLDILLEGLRSRPRA